MNVDTTPKTQNRLSDKFKSIDISFTVDEALFLYFLVGSVSGVGPLRDFSDELHEKLEELGFEYREGQASQFMDPTKEIVASDMKVKNR